MFDIFGAGFSGQNIGFSAQNSDEDINRESIVMPFLEVISNLREKVRLKAKELKNNELLSICDELRDDILPNLGVRLEDYDIGDGMTRTRLKLVDRETLLKEREEKLRAEEVKRVEREQRKREKEKLEELKEAQKKIPPSQMFKSETDKYSAFDEKGIPTHDNEGKELSKGLIKKLLKLYQTQEKKYNEYLKSSVNNELNGI
jgi:cysteinyl-tRNA synthetase